MDGVFDVAWHGRALRGDRASIQRLADFAIKPLYAFCLYRVDRDHALCEDVVQETMLVAIRRLNRYDPARSNGEIFGWLTGLARNEIRRALAARKQTRSLEAFWERMDRDLREIFSRIEEQPFDDEILARDETKQMVNITMSQLQPRYREALEAKYLNGKSVREMAGTMNKSEKAIESQLTRARAAFRETFTALVRNLNLESTWIAAEKKPE